MDQNKKNSWIKIGLWLGFLLLFLLDLYAIIDMPGNYILLVGITALVLGIGFLLGRELLQEMQQNKRWDDEKFEAILRSEKATYLLQKKTFDQISDAAEKIRASSAVEIISAQKAIAKIVITRNKESANAILNSNERVLTKLSELEGLFERSCTEFSEKQAELLEKQAELLGKQTELWTASYNELLQQQQELLSTTKQMEEVIKKELLEVEQHINTIQLTQQGGALMAPEAAAEDTDGSLLTEDKEALADLALDESLTLDESLALDESVEKAAPITAEGESEAEADDMNLDFNLDLGFDLNLASELDADLQPDAKFDLNLDFDFGDEEVFSEEASVMEEAAMEEVLPGEEAFSEELPMMEEAAMEEVLPGEEAFSEELPMMEEAAMEEAALSQALPEETPLEKEPETIAKPELPDSNKMMTPDEIAALIANL